MLNDPEDEKAIVDLIHRNRIAMWTQDFEAYQQCFVHASYLTRWNASRIGGIFIRSGWDNISSRVQRQFEDKSMYAPALAYETRVENLQLRISGDMAWATFEQHYPAPPPTHSRGPTVTNEMRLFERHQGVWRIAFLGFLTTENYGFSEGAILRLGADAPILWKSPEAEAALATADDLVIRAGRLRIRDTRIDLKFQAAVRWAAELDSQLVPGRGALPIVLDGGEDVPMRVCWVIGDSGTVFFSLGDARLYSDRLSAAAVVFGLSPAQKQVAIYVAQGLPLHEISGRMKITANTARTHLNRIFEKTGVHNQPALVRVLLSAGAPI